MKHLRMLDEGVDGEAAAADGNAPVTDINRKSGQ